MEPASQPVNGRTGIWLSLLLLSAAGLTFQINLTRLFSVSQFYHFAFMIVSIAMLGYGASGTALAIFPRLNQRAPQRNLIALGVATALSMLGSYVLINQLPFDSFSIAWETKQVWILVLHYGALASPFFFSGMAVGLLLAAYPQQSGRTYAINLLGSALGCLLALLAPSYLGGEGTVTLSSGMAALATLAAGFGKRALSPRLAGSRSRGRAPAGMVFIGLGSALVIFVLLDLGLRAGGRPGSGWLDLHLSPYKSLSYALQVPQAELIFQRWNSFSRVDVVRSPGIHSYPGLSYRYMQPLPPADGLMVDGDDLVPLLSPSSELEFTAFTPGALAFRLRPGAHALVLEPRGGLDLLVALAQRAGRVTAVEMNPLIVSAAGEIYQDERVELVIESDRSFLRRTEDSYDIIQFSLVSSYHPVRSGAYSLAEDYRYTIESFQDALRRLKPGGLLVVTRWLQTPPSESLRTFGLAVEAVERSGGDPHAQIVATRGYNTATILVKNGQFSAQELQTARDFSGQRAYDLVYAPGMLAEEANRYNILPEPVYYQAFKALLERQPRAAFYAEYPFAVKPPTDDHPFFGHYFKWAQAGQVLAELGRTWQPFGGAGYFVIVALLVLAVGMAGFLILLPAAVLSRRQAASRGQATASRGQATAHRGQATASRGQAARPGLIYPLYFGLIGLAFMQVEIPLIQRFILFLGHPAYALTAILFSLLSSSALGSRLSSRIPLRLALGLLVVLLLAAPLLLPRVFGVSLGQPLGLRLLITVLVIAPVGFLMGIPFPGGIRWMVGAEGVASQIPWIWAVNGAASVVSSVLAALLALSFGFDWVLRIGALAYAGAWLAVMAKGGWDPSRPPHQ
jgi:SAM-dependent methyltransferase